MKKLMTVGLMVLFGALLYASMASAAVTGCINAYTYNDTGVPTNVSVGNVCVNATDYDVGPTAAVFCADDWAAYVDGTCQYASYYVGYSGNGSATCDNSNWTVNTAAVFIAQDYIINTTTDAVISGSYVTNVGEAVPAKDACSNAYTLQGPTGYCNGGGELDTNGSLANVSAGNVCYLGTDAQPNATNYCGQWSDCVTDACVLDEYWVGYAGNGSATCVATDWVTLGTSWPSAGLRVNNTGAMAVCTYVATGGTPGAEVYTTCSNEYTLSGTQSTGYCNGAGGNATQAVTDNVTAGNVCYVGTDANPNATTNCGTWSDCVAENTTAAEYYVGYTGTGTAVCVATGKVAAGTTFTTAAGQTIWTTEVVDTCSVHGYALTYVKSDLPTIIEDGLGTVGAETVSWLDLIVLMIVLLFLAGIITKWKGMW